MSWAISKVWKTFGQVMFSAIESVWFMRASRILSVMQSRHKSDNAHRVRKLKGDILSVTDLGAAWDIESVGLVEPVGAAKPMDAPRQGRPYRRGSQKWFGDGEVES